MLPHEPETSQDEREFPPGAPTPATGVRRVLYAAAGLVCVGLAYLGVLLPGLPATPWVLLAGYCFARSSPRLERWLKKSPVFGKLLHDWHEHRGMRRSAKVIALLLIVAVVSLSITFGGLPIWLRWTIGGLAAIGICVILFVVPTVRPEARGQRTEDREQRAED
jgi:uncharacterized membrane protein YbaN (DUF454 family)